jgi:hypothetical protein
MKKSKRIILAIAPALSAVLACSAGGSDDPQDRDVYKSKEECVKDWSEGDLCEQMAESDERNYDGGGHGYYWGPVYYRGSRSVSYNGRTITSSGGGSTMRPYSISSASSSSARSSKSSPTSSSSTRTGGFGSRSSSTSGS